MRVAIVLCDLGGGGAERLHTYLANDWVSRGIEVDVVLLQKRGHFLSLLAPDVKVFDLRASRFRSAIVPLALHLNRTKPDVLLVATWPLTTCAVLSWLLSGRHSRIFLSEHANLSAHCIGQMKISATVLKSTLRLIHPRATGVIAVSQGVKDDLCKLGGFDANLVTVIHNPTAVGIRRPPLSLQERRHLWSSEARFRILAVGALKEQKDHETLIRAFARASTSLDAKLVILGEGPLRPKLQALIQELELDDRVDLPGFSIDPYPWYLSADVFVLSSKYEGFGNVIVEALECGVPIVSTNCPSGPAEILQDGRYGTLVPVGDYVAMSQAIVETLLGSVDREGLISRATDFSVASISIKYLQCFGLDHCVR